MALLGVGVAGCGSGSSSSSGSSTAAKSTTTTSALPKPPEPPPNADEGTVFGSLGSAAGLGEVLVDSEGHTLYAFSSDSPTSAAVGAV